jgi:hypothetical protein
VFTAFFALVGLLPLWSGRPIRSWALAVSVVFFAAALLKPAVLAPLNRVWIALGLLLTKITNPIVLGLLFYAVFTPYGWVMRLFGSDRLHRRFDRQAASYWIPRQPPGPAADSMSKQF